MITLRLSSDLPSVSITITYQGNSLTLDNALLDTGSYSTILATDCVSHLGLQPLPDDTIHLVYGVGGTEPVVEKIVDSVMVDGHSLPDVPIQLGALDYGIPLEAIIGFDLLTSFGAIIDFHTMTLHAQNGSTQSGQT